jgi:hypothetical protein
MLMIWSVIGWKPLPRSLLDFAMPWRNCVRGTPSYPCRRICLVLQRDGGRILINRLNQSHVTSLSIISSHHHSALLFHVNFAFLDLKNVLQDKGYIYQSSNARPLTSDPSNASRATSQHPSMPRLKELLGALEKYHSDAF